MLVRHGRCSGVDLQLEILFCNEVLSSKVLPTNSIQKDPSYLSPFALYEEVSEVIKPVYRVLKFTEEGGIVANPLSQ